jgi:hypothetical protein
MVLRVRGEVVKLVNHVNLTLGPWRKRESSPERREAATSSLIESGGREGSGRDRCEERWSSAGPLL